ncbi:hypothetical protein [Mycobacterium conspicuum]|jgi:hypothetical protein|uniref:Uncharacterized protein n=1 Tax=Mycobacterium conspicuum TaxID=44010 RepID=A0A7I7Y9X1_9MYCO|nr:hypothetical protein [Mycobacterium conspicuum]BBZ38508.1 hypothetical protein MCNS_15710 [Mycobacterium conspicuum]
MPEFTTPNRRGVPNPLHAALRAAPAQRAAAEAAAIDFHQGLWPALRAEIRWAFTPPRIWLTGVVANFVLAVGWLAFQRMTAAHVQHRVPSHYHHAGAFHHNQIDWVILISAYFASFVLADVTTTNVLGADHHRVAKGLSQGAPFWRVLLLKNLTLLVIVGVPTLAVAVALTLWKQTPADLGDTIPNVAVPVVSWLGVGNVISVLLPVGSEPLMQRWHDRRDWRRTATWILALTLPYALYYVADPLGGVEHEELWTTLPAAIGPILGRDTKSFVHLGIAVAVWAAGTLFACWWERRRGLRFR